jgi:hypothetical protein
MSARHDEIRKIVGNAKSSNPQRSFLEVFR